MSALAAIGAGRAAERFGNAAVVVAGLATLAVSLLVRLSFRLDTPIVVVGIVIALTTVGGAIVQTPQATVMMASAPTNLGGVVSAVKASVGGTFYGLGSRYSQCSASSCSSGTPLRSLPVRASAPSRPAKSWGHRWGPSSAGLDPERTAQVIAGRLEHARGGEDAESDHDGHSSRGGGRRGGALSAQARRHNCEPAHPVLTEFVGQKVKPPPVGLEFGQWWHRVSSSWCAMNAGFRRRRSMPISKRSR